MSSAQDAPSPQGGAQSTKQENDNDNTLQKVASVRQVKITRPEVGSLYDIMHDHAGVSLYVLPICWTDQHTRLLGAKFLELPTIVTPVPKHIPGRQLEPSSLARGITSELHVLLKGDNKKPAGAMAKTRAMKHILATLFPNHLSRAKSNVDLDLHFGNTVFKKALKVHCIWKANGAADSSFDSATTIVKPDSFGDVFFSSDESTRDFTLNRPVVAFVNRGNLASIRRHLFRVVSGPDGTKNEPVARLQRLRSQMLTPANKDHDPFIVATLISMAQSHFYDLSRSRSSSPSVGGKKTHCVPPSKFHNIKVRVITQDESDICNPHFIIYSAVVSAAFLDRFHQPSKASVSTAEMESNGSLDIQFTRVCFWPILGLKERLAKALGREIIGAPLWEDPEYIGLWHPLLATTTKYNFPSFHHSAPKRNHPHRDPLPEVLNSSSEDETPESSDDRPIMSPSAKRRRTQAVNTLEVC